MMHEKDEARVMSTAETGVGERSTDVAAASHNGKTPQMSLFASDNTSHHLCPLDGRRNGPGKAPPNGTNDVLHSWRQRTRSFLAPKILFFGVLFLPSFAVLIVCEALIGATSTPAVVARMLFSASLVLFTTSLWINMAPSVLRLLIVRPRYALQNLG